jgi:hypothetical protein
VATFAQARARLEAPGGGGAADLLFGKAFNANNGAPIFVLAAASLFMLKNPRP